MSQLGKVLPASAGRRLVIPDIHACLNTLQALLKKLDLSSKDQLIFLGDYVNKGNHNRKTLEFLMDLREKYDCHFLRGNHDQKIIDYFKSHDESLKQELKDLNSTELLSLEKAEEGKFLGFLDEMSHFFISDTFILVHAGLDFTLTNPFLGKEAMLNIRGFSYDSKRAQNKTVVHGHYPYPLKDIKENIDTSQRVIPLDNGCVYPDREGQGNLLCLDLDSFDLKVQKNLDN